MRAWIIAAVALAATPAAAQDIGTPDEVAQDSTHHPTLRDLCSDRPGLNTPACTVDPGRLQVEVGLGDWTLDRQADQRSDTITSGDVLLRYGVTPTTELRLGWTAFGHVRTRDIPTGSIDTAQGVGDVTLGVKQNLRHPAEGKTGLAIAALPFVTLPTGHAQVGAGDWSAGLIVPTSYKINDTVSLELSPEVDAAVNESSQGRHLAYGTAMGVQVHLSKTVRLTPELQFLRDQDPEHHATMSRAALSFDVQPAKMLQLDVQAVAGLNRDTPDVELAFGVTRKF
ncbi:MULTISPECIES: transporter [unclassified Novosphingobium]|uniref:transporter n=1 Tax=unclassified Novosphingobium TaxID=2644732 RepID=UPI000D325588|nr:MULTISPECIES: transporter [unclassified Novosphingobium]PTR12827.1 outer membrane putative beta-barrel porin/alpha-amylase [Novosphingobium sp. GV055]PUB06611.1 outer membrane putative beta-barrel porin/alpha-amylase [Novosphingobium sp. GV061]PUB22662.1 outer membrane putative beta-barrel porin/alpha-amylase [Novosphingobium sp. GV079]PUB44687.1 outer membrane putative beta-barrel porin/alpha-amylase [Novosphingobium sp. GV027]